MARITDLTTAEHYKWGGVNDGWHLVKRDDLSIISERMVPGSAEIEHYHQKSRQFFQVLVGELTMNVEGNDSVIQTGQGVEIAPGQLHQARNASSMPVEFLVVSMPKSHGDRVEINE